MADTKSLIGLIGFYDNLSEPKPLSNYPETIIALALTFLVRRGILLIPGWYYLSMATLY